MNRYDDVTAQLRSAYATSAKQRDQGTKTQWKLDERRAFLNRLAVEGKRRLLEIGAGTGHDGAYFVENGLEVVATDLTPEMVDLCREKGLEAHVMDVLQLDFADASFDAVWTINCLLHVPNADLPSALIEIDRVLRPEGLFFFGVYGGDVVGEGINEDDWHDPPRFFSFRSDDELQTFVRTSFEIVDFHVVSGGESFRFQSVTARKRSQSPDERQ